MDDPLQDIKRNFERAQFYRISLNSMKLHNCHHMKLKVIQKLQSLSQTYIKDLVSF